MPSCALRKILDTHKLIRAKLLDTHKLVRAGNFLGVQ